MRVAELAAMLGEWIPEQYAEDWDNVGLLLGDPSEAVRGVLCAIDATPAVIAEAASLGANVLFVYHPPLFRAPRRLTPGDRDGDLAFRLLQTGIAVYSPHTAFDAVPEGPNALLAELLGLRDSKPLRLRATIARAGAASVHGSGSVLPQVVGMGRIGTVETTREQMIRTVRERLQLAHVMVAGPTSGGLARVAICAGSGSSLFDLALAQGAQLLVTGELAHHDALRAARCGMTIVATLHSHTERLALAPFTVRLASQLAGPPNIPVYQSASDCDPFTIV
jgi:dinuclear metal center YbgI/SA1388 family protein